MRSAKLRYGRTVVSLLTLALAILAAYTHAFAISGSATESVLSNFPNPDVSNDGVNPYADLLIDNGGNLYGTTEHGGTNPGPNPPFNAGTVFELSPPSTPGGSWTESILYNFGSFAGDGATSYAGLIMDGNGNLYGTTKLGGSFKMPGGGGTAFELSPPSTSGGNWTETILWDFGNPVNGTDGLNPYAGLLMDANGNLYGTTSAGGQYTAVVSSGGGTAFKLTQTAGGSWNESLLWNFGNMGDGATPFAGLTLDANGNLYGTTKAGGANGVGTVFKLIPPSSSGANWSEAVLYNFAGGTSDGATPFAGVTLDASGNLFGTTTAGGANSAGTVFELTRPVIPGGAWSESIVYNLGSYKVDGTIPYGGLIIDPSGDLFGTTTAGGTKSAGTAFELTPGAAWVESILANFAGAEGSTPDGGLIFGQNDGELFGTTFAGGGNNGGTVFEISLPTASPSASATPTPSRTPTPTSTPTAIPTATPTPTLTPTPTPTVTPTPAPTPTPTPSGPAALTISPKTMGFGNIDYAFAGAATKVRKLTITNPAKYKTAAIISSIIGTAGFTADPACTNVTLAAGGKLVCNITYAPTGLGGVSGTLTIRDNVPGGSQTVGVSGAGIQGRLTATPGTLNFGKVPLNTTSAAKNVTLRNRTASTFTISSISHGDPAFVASQNCVGPLGTTTCAVTVTYAPTVTTKVTDTLTITDEPDGITRTVNLIGTGK